MATTVRVSQADVVRAQLVIELNETLGRPTATYIRKIAAARPATPGSPSSPTR